MILLTDEPVELRDRLRVLAATSPDDARGRLVDEVAELAADGVQPGFDAFAVEIDFKAVCRGYERELWLWLVGERTWTQCASGLQGRFLRRVEVLRA